MDQKIKDVIDNRDIPPLSLHVIFGNRQESEEQNYEKMLELFEHRVASILMIDCREDKIFLTEKEKEKLPFWVRHYLRFSEHRGIKLYHLALKGGSYMAVGVFGASAGRENEYYFNKLLQEPSLQSKIQTTQIKISELLSLVQKSPQKTSPKETS